MKFYEKLALPILKTLNSEIAHDLSILILKSNLISGPGNLTSDRLRTDICGLSLPNPLGLAAGYDKNAKVVEYICSTSKLRGNDDFKPIVESRICSRFK